MTATAPQVTLNDYVKEIAGKEPTVALEILLAETARQQAMAKQAAEEYRAMAEVEFDGAGRIIKANMAGLHRLAQIYATSSVVPEHYRSRNVDFGNGKPDWQWVDARPDCFIACQMAFRLKIDPLAYMQSSYIVHGKPGIEAKLATALLNTSGKIKGRIRYKFDGEGDKRRCTAYCTDKETGEEVSAYVDWAMVKAEGWLGKKGSKWQTMPDVMFPYRAATFLIRRYYSEVLMGVQIAEELEDIGPPDSPSGSGKAAETLDDLTERLMGPPPPGGESALEPGETMKSDGEIINPDETSQLDPLEGVESQFAAFDMKGPATQLYDSLCSPDAKVDLSDAQRTLVTAWYEAACLRIDRSRGEKSNKSKQPALAGTT